jgi:hypothetical protein
MLEADQWDRVLANVKGTIVGGTDRVSSNRLLDLLDVGPDPGSGRGWERGDGRTRRVTFSQQRRRILTWPGKWEPITGASALG